MKVTTLLFLIRDDTSEILLAMKKCGFGAGKLNGVGGKVEPGETIERAAVREAEEEIGVRVEETNLIKVAEHEFSFIEHPDWALRCHVFFAHTWSGEPDESEEMAPQWFPQDGIPFERMWIDDQYWLPRVLKGETLKAEFHFDGDGGTLSRYRIENVPA